MRIARLEIEGARGQATLWRETDEIVARVSGHERGYMNGTWRAHARRPGEQAVVARTVQRILDGYDGTAGDVAGYQHVIELLAD